MYEDYWKHLQALVLSMHKGVLLLCAGTDVTVNTISIRAVTAKGSWRSVWRCNEALSRHPASHNPKLFGPTKESPTCATSIENVTGLRRWNSPFIGSFSLSARDLVAIPSSQHRGMYRIPYGTVCLRARGISRTISLLSGSNLQSRY